MESSSSHLYERLGGEIGIERLVGRFYERVQADEHLAPFFEHVPMGRLKMMQKEFFSEAVGGPLYYTGRSLRQVHAGRGIRKEDLRRFTGHLVATLKEAEKELGISPQETHAIYSRIAIEADRITDDVTESA
ncbi:MAG: group 1 truncated hemoglobin [Akkermansiaceae bacterium]|nr:group 1 truncated hemoglobin [Akkermansiaceae bacterium]